MHVDLTRVMHQTSTSYTQTQTNSSITVIFHVNLSQLAVPSVEYIEFDKGGTTTILKFRSHNSPDLF